MSRRRAQKFTPAFGRARPQPPDRHNLVLHLEVSGGARLPAVSLGDWFCLPVDANDGPVYHWSRILAESREVAPDLSTFWRDWLGGTISA